MAARYEIMLDSPLGQRPGALTLREEGGQVRGTLALLGFDNPVDGRRDGPLLRLRHTLRTRVSRLECETTLRPGADGALMGTVQVGSTCMDLRGRKLPEDTTERMKRTYEPEYRR